MVDGCRWREGGMGDRVAIFVARTPICICMAPLTPRKMGLIWLFFLFGKTREKMAICMRR